MIQPVTYVMAALPYRITAKRAGASVTAQVLVNPKSLLGNIGQLPGKNGISVVPGHVSQIPSTSLDWRTESHIQGK